MSEEQRIEYEVNLKSHIVETEKKIGRKLKDEEIKREKLAFYTYLSEFQEKGKAIFSQETIGSLMRSDIPSQLIVIAGEQQRLWAA